MSAPRALRSVLVALSDAPSDGLIERVTSLPMTSDSRIVFLRARSVGDVAAEARLMRPDVIVVAPGERFLGEFLLGNYVARILRATGTPVLVTRHLVKRAYQNPLIALDANGAAFAVLSVARTVLEVPKLVTLLHAVEVPFLGLIYPSLSEQAARDVREGHRERACRWLRCVAQTARVELGLASVPGWSLDVRLGEPRSVIRAQVEHSGSDLLVIGTRMRSALGRALFQGVAMDVIRAVTCDVLVVPHGRR